MAILAKTLASAIAAPGVQAGVDLAALSRSISVQVIPTTDMACVVEIDGSLDNANWFSLGRKSGPGIFSSDGDVIQYLRANIITLASGTVTIYGSFVSG